MDAQPSNDFDTTWLDAVASVDMLDMLDGLTGSLSDIHIVSKNMIIVLVIYEVIMFSNVF
jgi:hypothetical protein